MLVIALDVHFLLPGTTSLQHYSIRRWPEATRFITAISFSVQVFLGTGTSLSELSRPLGTGFEVGDECSTINFVAREGQMNRKRPCMEHVMLTCQLKTET